MYDETKRQREMTLKQEDHVFTVELDCFIADLIVALNEKQFYTEYCCSGHIEDAFMGMYIKFYPMDKIYENIIRAIISRIPEFYIEENYEMSCNCETSNHYIQLSDPTPEEFKMAKQIVFRKHWDNDEFTKLWTTHYIIIRPTISKDYFITGCREDLGSVIETNRNIVFNAINKFKRHIGLFSIFGV